MVQTLWTLCRSGELWRHIAVSCGETVLGFTAGTLLGTAAAVGMWWSDTAARILDPYLVVLNALPKTALGPIFIVWMGAGMGAIVTMTLAISLDRHHPEYVRRLPHHRPGEAAADADAGR